MKKGGQLTKVQVCTSIILGVSNTIGFVLLFIYTLSINKIPIQFLTHWGFWMNSSVLISNLICDVSLYFFNLQKFERMNNFFRNYFSQVSLSFSYEIVSMYWIFFAFGWVKLKKGILDFIFCIYVHGLICLLVLIDFTLHTNRYNLYINTFNWKILTAITAIFMSYCIQVGIAIYVFNRPPYYFVKNLEAYQLILMGIGFYIVLTMFYFIHLGILKMRNKMIKEEDTEDKEDSEAGEQLKSME